MYTWANGDRYEGEWKDGNLHGKGIKVLTSWSTTIVLLCLIPSHSDMVE